MAIPEALVAPGRKAALGGILSRFSISFHKEFSSSTASAQPDRNFLLQPFLDSSKVPASAYVRCLKSAATIADELVVSGGSRG